LAIADLAEGRGAIVLLVGSLYRRQPAGHRATVVRVGIAEPALQMRLFVVHDEEVEGQEDQRGVAQHRGRGKDQRLANQHQHDSQVHGVAHVAVRPGDHERLRRVNRRRCAFADEGKTRRRPEVGGDAQEKRQKPRELQRAEARWGRGRREEQVGNEDGDRAGHQDGEKQRPQGRYVGPPLVGVFL